MFSIESFINHIHFGKVRKIIDMCGSEKQKLLHRYENFNAFLNIFAVYWEYVWLVIVFE
jgi:hypothetical protein